jgi:hypothetical protein
MIDEEKEGDELGAVLGPVLGFKLGLDGDDDIDGVKSGGKGMLASAFSMSGLSEAMKLAEVMPVDCVVAMMP